MIVEESSFLIKQAREILGTIDFDAINKAGISKDKFTYEYTYQYPPPITLKPIKMEDVYSKRRGSKKSPSLQKLHVYVHIPFCTDTCIYCHYVRFPKPSEKIINRYLDSVKQELEILNKLTDFEKQPIFTLHFGGGTPSYLDSKKIKSFIGVLISQLNLEPESEVTVESSPETLNKSKLETLLECGVNRLSIGIQSFDNKILKLCKRAHNVKQITFALEIARESGFSNINFDLMYGLPLQTPLSWEQTLKKTEELSPEHVTIYQLRIRPNTEMGANRNSLPFPNEEEILLMQVMAIEFFKMRGYTQTAVNCFAKARKYTHKYQNLRYENQEYIGLGVSAHSYNKNAVYFNERSMQMYIRQVSKNRLPIQVGKRLSVKERARRKIILGLKALEATKPTETSLPNDLISTLQKLIEIGLINDDGTSLFLSDVGVLWIDEICRELCSCLDKQQIACAGSTYGNYFPYVLEKLSLNQS